MTMQNFSNNIQYILHYIVNKDDQSTTYQKIYSSSSMSVKTVKKDGSGTYNLF